MDLLTELIKRQQEEKERLNQIQNERQNRVLEPVHSKPKIQEFPLPNNSTDNNNSYIASNNVSKNTANNTINNSNNNSSLSQEINKLKSLHNSALNGTDKQKQDWINYIQNINSNGNDLQKQALKQYNTSLTYTNNNPIVNVSEQSLNEGKKIKRQEDIKNNNLIKSFSTLKDNISKTAKDIDNISNLSGATENLGLGLQDAVAGAVNYIDKAERYLSPQNLLYNTGNFIANQFGKSEKDVLTDFEYNGEKLTVHELRLLADRYKYDNPEKYYQLNNYADIFYKENRDNDFSKNIRDWANSEHQKVFENDKENTTSLIDWISDSWAENDDINKAREEKMKENINKGQNIVGRKLAELTAGAGSTALGATASLINPVLGTAMFMTSAGGSYFKDAKERGMNDDQAFVYSTIMGGVEGLSEKFITGDYISQSKKLATGKGLSEKVLKSYGMDIGENFLQEALTEPISEMTAYAVGGKDKANFENMKERMLQSGFDGLLSGTLYAGASAGIGSALNVLNKGKNASIKEITQAYNDVVNSGKIDVKEIAKNNLPIIQEKLNTELQQQNNQEKNPNIENVINDNINKENRQDILSPTRENFENKTVNNQNYNDMQQINQQNEKMSQNGLSEQIDTNINIPISNKINEKVSKYIENIDKFESNINLNTNVINEGDISPINYTVNSGQSVLFNKAKSLVDKLKKRIFINNSEKIFVTNADIKKSISETLKNKEQQPYINENLVVFSQLDKIIENAEEISFSKEDNKNRSQYGNYKYYVSKVNIDNKPFIVEFDTRMQKGSTGKDERHFRLERVYEYKKTDSQDGANNLTTRFSSESVLNNIIPQNETNNNRNYTNLSDIKLPINENLRKTNKEKNPLPTKEYFENKEKLNLLTDKDLEVLNDIYEKANRTEVLTEKKKANILEKYASDKFAIKDSLDILTQKLVNKGHYVDKLVKEAKNPELKFLYDRNLNSFAEGQYVIGVAQTNNKGEQIGKSINDIWKPIEDSKLTKEFSEYLLHKHNIARSGKGKYIFGTEIGPTESTAIALELEKEHPEFKQYAMDIKEFNHNNLNNLKEAGLISQDTIDYIETMYPDYIVVSRNVEDKLYDNKGEKTGTNSPLKKATGGNSDIQPIKDAMAEQAIRIKRLVNQNELGKELSKTLKNAKVEDENSKIEVSPSLLLDMDSMVDTDINGNKYYIYFENGEQKKLRINDNLYESLKPSEISRIEKTLPIKALQKVNNVHRSLLTSSNPKFIVTNFFKDIQDGFFNSKYSRKFIKNYAKAIHEFYIKGKYYQSYMANGGMNNSYFDYNEGIKKKSNKFVQKIRNANEVIEQLPRLAEFISTIEDGKSLNEALYNAAEVTTNFKRGGDITKAINRNGANFLNASVQGLSKFYRNISGQNGIKGYMNLLIKSTLLSVAPSILNHILLDDDEDYQDLPQYVKDEYYLFKTGNGKFIRIPKGRVTSVIGATARRIVEDIQGQNDAWEGFGETVINQMAPNNPLEENILSPIIQVKNNKTWYGSDLVSSRLSKELPKNQYDETTDEFSKWLGSKINVSPKKINYLIDQYSGGIGDILLPTITPQAKQNTFVDTFTTDSVLKNKNVSKFYNILDKQNQIVNDSFVTDDDRLKLKYLNSVSKDMSDLYKEKREVQMSKISNSEKTDKVREIQAKINDLAEKRISKL